MGKEAILTLRIVMSFEWTITYSGMSWCL